MDIEENDAGIRAAGNWYRLEVNRDEPLWASLHVEGTRAATLFVPSSVDASAGGDMVGPPANWRVERDEAACRLTAEGGSSVWARKRYVFECADDWLTYGVEVEGSGRIETLHFFEGFLRETLDRYDLKPGDFLKQRRFWRSIKDWLTGSVAGFVEVFNPEPIRTLNQCIPAFEASGISVTNTRVNEHGSWFFTPGPLCFCLHVGEKWVAVGVVAKPGENSFADFEYTGGELFGFQLTYDGHAHVEGTWQSPKLVFLLADNEYAAVERYVAWLREHGYVPVPQRAIPSWWRRPILCGWGEQCHLRELNGAEQAAIYATQEIYERFVGIAKEKQLPFGTLVIDDKWQDFYGLNRPDTEKWPDLRGFIDRMAAEGIHVLLWYKAWYVDGVPPEECILKDGEPLRVDPTNPAFEQRLREQVRFMLSPDEGCLNAAGFKVDCTNLIAAGPGCRLHDDTVWGLELMKRLLSIIYSAAKEAKPDAMIITHTANPYLGDVTDVLRLNDISSDLRSVVPVMEHRAKIARIACPEWLIDCDNAPLTNLEAWREYIECQPVLGVPSLYYLTSLEAENTEFTEADYELIRRVWGEYLDTLEG